jgi:hypothetical protein
MSKPTFTLEFSANAFFAFSNNSLFNILLLTGVPFSLLGDYPIFFYDFWINMSSLPFLSPLGDYAFQAILALNLSFLSRSS